MTCLYKAIIGIQNPRKIIIIINIIYLYSMIGTKLKNTMSLKVCQLNSTQKGEN